MLLSPKNVCLFSFLLICFDSSLFCKLFCFQTFWP
ncbi:putative signal peptide protein [Puccinia sorghi]|uniref:Putative signal peptide protein n=1 Tax=Puccinia sorghi TaxID=27349 RepID=A0A0L6VES8_9BASI|nr:putative signal peptide protein [Puccinia sorghi]